MSNSLVTTDIFVNNNKIGIMRVGNVDYISLTDIAKVFNSMEPSFTIKNWLRKFNTIKYIGLWEELHNNNFNLVEYDQIKNSCKNNSFVITPTKWKNLTNAIGIIPSLGKYSKGTYAHPDIAFEFASWLSPEFKLYLK